MPLPVDKEQSPDPPESEAKSSGITAFWAELKRRHVVRVAMVYLVVGWLVIQVANATFEEFGIPSWAYRFVVLMVALGFPISVIVAWAFELTPEGIKTSKTAREEHPDSHTDASHAKKHNWLSLGMAAAVPTLIFGAVAIFFYFRSDTAPSSSIDKSIAVLPLANLSADPEQEYFTDGMTEALITDLAQISTLKVISRTSVMRYKDTSNPCLKLLKSCRSRWCWRGPCSVSVTGCRLPRS